MAVDSELALEYLGNRLYEALLLQRGAVRPADLVRSLPVEARVSVGLIRAYITEDERFVETDRRFDIADRYELRRRPFGGVVTALLEGFGRPVPEPELVSAMARIGGATPSYYRDLLRRYLEGRDEAVFIDDFVVAASWLLRMEGDNEQELLFYNGLESNEHLQEMLRACERRDLRKHDLGATAANIIDSFGEPIGALELALLVYRHHPQIFDSVEFMAQVLSRDDIVPISGPRFILEKHLSSIHRELRKLSEEAATEEDELPKVDLVEVLTTELPPDSRYYLEENDLQNILATIGAARMPIGIDELLAQLLELKPGSKNYAAAAQSLQGLLDDDTSLLTLSPGRYLPKAAVPKWVEHLPPELQPAEAKHTEDIMVALEGLGGELLERVLDARYEDVLCGIEIEPDEGEMAEEETTYAVQYHHYLAGTMPLRAMDRRLFVSESPIALFILSYGDAEMFPVWLNRDLGLLLGFTTWYQKYLPPAGASFSIARGAEPETYLVKYEGEKDKETYIEPERLAELERKRERVARRPTSSLELLVELMGDHASGIGFDALWAEANVVRRTTRHQIASLLAYYKCFECADEEAGLWVCSPELVREGGREELKEYVTRAVGQEEAQTGEEERDAEASRKDE